jgi:NAD(P)-dependent dehydrogenase (short-subunit alcohol dehydrogenase family)
MNFVIPDSIPRAALVTGGAPLSGVVTALAGAGFAIALQCDSGFAADLPGGTLALPADLVDETQTEFLIGRATAALGPIGVLVNGATTCVPDTRDHTSRTAWDRNFAINVRAPFVLTRQFAAVLPPGREGVAINLLDQRVRGDRMSCAASQAALRSLTRSMALALAPRVRVNGIAGPVHTGDAVMAILALASMTGQMMEPDGVLS